MCRQGRGPAPQRLISPPELTAPAEEQPIIIAGWPYSGLGRQPYPA